MHKHISMHIIKDASIMLGFDFGLKRIGVASGQFITGTATPVTIVSAKNGQPNWEAVSLLVVRYRPQALVVGLPLHMNETQQPITKKAKQFANKLQQYTDITTYLIDERLSTKAVRAALFEKDGYKALKKADINSLSAAIILEQWMRLHKNLCT